MNKNAIYIILAILIIGVLIGVGVWQSEDTITENEDIILGKINVDENAIKELQESVDSGHQPWRLEPLMVAQAEDLGYGFSENDEFILKTTAASAATAEIEVIHNNEKYLIKLIQVVPGEGQIWTIYEIKKI